MVKRNAFSRQVESISPSTTEVRRQKSLRKDDSCSNLSEKSWVETSQTMHTRDDNLWHSLNRGISEFDKGLFYYKYQKFVEARRLEEQEATRERDYEQTPVLDDAELTELFELRYPAKSSGQLQQQIDELYHMRRQYIKPHTLQADSLELYDFLLQVFIYLRGSEPPDQKTISKNNLKSSLRKWPTLMALFNIESSLLSF
jgi:hypothetical protein